MSTTTLLIVIVVAVVALIVIGAIAMAARRTRMRSLPEESKTRYAQQWRAIESRFLEDPGAAVREADQLAVSILQERGATIDDQHMPKDLREAREAAQRSEGRPGTEDLRLAMIEYQHIVDDAIGVANRKWAKTGRREAA